MEDITRGWNFLALRHPHPTFPWSILLQSSNLGFSQPREINSIIANFCFNLLFLALLLVIKLVIGVQRLKKKESKQFVNSMPKYLTAKRPSTHIITSTRTGQQRNTLGDVMSALCPVV